MNNDCITEDMKKEERDSPQMVRLRSDSGEKMHILKHPRFDIRPVLDPPLPPDIIIDCDYKKKDKNPLVRTLKQSRVDYPPVLDPLLPPDIIFDRDFDHPNFGMKV